MWRIPAKTIYINKPTGSQPLIALFKRQGMVPLLPTVPAVHGWQRAVLAGLSPIGVLPPIGEDADLLVGQRETASKATVPIRQEKMLGLLNSLHEKPQLRLAVALVGIYGLRPAELMALSIDEGQLKVGNVKRNSKTARNPKPPRLVLPLD